MAEKELVLKLGLEGGGATIYRSAFDTGRWQFHVEGSSIYLDENDVEGWQSWRSEPILTIEDALRFVAKDGFWVFFYPVSVHPEYRTAVWALANLTAKSLPEEQSKLWYKENHEWQSLCQDE